jgi:hypothetical protein
MLQRSVEKKKNVYPAVSSLIFIFVGKGSKTGVF